MRVFLLSLFVCGSALAQDIQSVIDLSMKPSYTYNEGTGKFEVSVALDGKVCSDNSTTNVLGAGEVFVGDWQRFLGYGGLVVNPDSDQSSAVNGFIVQWSDDGINVGNQDQYTYTGGTFDPKSPGPPLKYFRVIYTNGVTPQTHFRLSSTLHKAPIKFSSHKVGEPIDDEDDAELVVSVIKGASDDGIYRTANVDVDGNLTITDNSSGIAIARGDVTGTSFIHKFGNAPDFDTTDGSVTVWDGADDGQAWENMVYDYSTSADINRISSSDNSDNQSIEIYGLDTNTNLVTQTATLNGTNSVSLSTNLYRIFRMVNRAQTSATGHVLCYVNTPVSGGIPVDKSKIRAIIDNGNNQTLMSLYTIPAGYTGYMRDWYVAIAGANKSSNYRADLISRRPGEVFTVKHRSAISDSGTSTYQHKYEEPEMFLEGTDIEMRVSALAAGVTAASISAGFDLVLIEN